MKKLFMFRKTILAVGRRNRFSEHDIAGDAEEILGFFDANFYCATYGSPDGDELTLAAHYLALGWRMGRDPSPFFSTGYYLSANPDVKEAGVNPLLHYVRFGKSEGRATAPSAATGEAVAKQKVSTEELAGSATTASLGKIMGRRLRCRWKGASWSRHPDEEKVSLWFDREFYCSSFPKGSAPKNPVSHYLRAGWKEGRDPAPWFSTRHYLAMNEDVARSKINPFVHYCLTGRHEKRSLVSLGKPMEELYSAHEASVAPGPQFEEFDPGIGVGRRKRAKVLAYYLPQFHSIEINDQNWGRGFTEWRNLARAMPRFEGHVQPRIPRDLGFYDLSERDAMRRQVELAKAAGLFGFCFYHYWFDGLRVLEAPLERFLVDKSIDFPFCLMWANENWTRTWDGAESEIILKQSYDPGYDEALVADFARHMRDKRYIKIGNRPLMFIYRPGHIEDAGAAILRWRKIFAGQHNLSPLIFMAQGFGDTDPEEYGLDGAVEFPPHKLARDLPPINSSLNWLDPEYKGHVFDYDAIVKRSLNEGPNDFPLIKTATPSWDNEARRPGRGMILHGSTPRKFEAWMAALVARAQKDQVFGESIVCVNAWNEWAEGAVLEPDVHFGGAFLNALSRAVHGVPSKGHREAKKVLIVGHDANQNGAQNLALHIGRCLRESFGVTIAYLLDEGGPLIEKYRQVGEVFVSSFEEESTQEILRDLFSSEFSVAITNTTASGLAVSILKQEGFAVVSLIHELPGLLRSYKLTRPARTIAESSDHVIFPASVVRNGFETFAGPISNESEIIPQGLYNTNVLDAVDADLELRVELGLSKETKIVLGVGYADLRKGIDRFIAAGLSVCSRRSDCAFIWVGAPEEETVSWLKPEISAAGLSERVRIVGHKSDVERYFAAADLFYLSSREDPFPSVVLEALASGLPIVGHDGCGGCDALVAKHGTLVESSDPFAAAAAIQAALREPKSSQLIAAQARRQEITRNYLFEDYTFAILRRLFADLPSVSAVVPNYNYADYISERLRSVFDQDLPLREVLVLDDASTDDSVKVIKRTAEAAGRKIALYVSETNTGSPFMQWLRGLEFATSDYVWIAEADDLARPDLVSRIVRRMEEAGSVLGFCDSRQMDENDVLLGESYRNYLDDIEPCVFGRDFDMDGRAFLSRFLSVKNVILNVSSVVFRRDALLEAFRAVGDELLEYRVAGDWRLYVELCAEGGRVSYLSSPLNSHRRHSTSVTHALNVQRHLDEISKIQEIVRQRAAIDEEKVKQQREHYESCRRHLEGRQ